jgi:serine/threonine protein kinase
VYEVQAPLGAGGMGVVYRALDTNLNRPVAIKFLSRELADADARRRFQREAQLASSLNHPHILTVFDAGEFEGRQYLVTEHQAAPVDRRRRCSSSHAIGSSDMNTMPSATSEKFSFTTGTLPKAKPAPMHRPTQMTAPITL